MSVYVTVDRRGPAHPYGVYDGIRVGDGFMMDGRGLADVSQALQSVTKGLVSESVQSLEIRSQVSPPIVVERPLAYEEGGQPEVTGGTPLSRRVLEFIKPEVVVNTAAGPLTVRPWGEPTKNYAVPIMVGAAAALGLGILATVKIAQWAICPRR